MNNLLKQNSFYRFSYENKKYVFFSGSQRILEIGSPLMDAYFTLCTGDETADKISDNEIVEITATLNSLCTPPKHSATEPRQDMLTLNVTHGCNMACKYCFASTTQDRKEVMSLSVARKAIENMLKANPASGQYTIYFFGGEPLLHKSFLHEVVAMAKEEIVGKRGKKVIFLVNTNGTLIDESLLRLFKEEKFTVTVSMDGPEDINDENRIFTNGRGSYRRIIRNIEKLKEHHIRFNIRATIHPNTRKLFKIIRFFETLKVPYSYAFTMDSGTERKYTFDFGEIDLDRFDQQLAECTTYLVAKRMNGEPIYNLDFCNGLKTLKDKTVRLQGCSAGRSNLIVDEQGCYYACQNMLPLRETSLGDVNSGIQENRLNEFRSQDVAQLDNCRQCWARYLCGGSCLNERYLHGSQSVYISMKCRLIRTIWKHRIHSYIALESFINNMSN